ncbi:MAG: O-antigen ligase family protein [Vicinamibacterales bacterium]
MTPDHVGAPVLMPAVFAIAGTVRIAGGVILALVTAWWIVLSVRLPIARLSRLSFGVLVGSLAVVQFNLLGAQILFGWAAIGWLSLLLRDRMPPSLPLFAWPLAGYAALTLVSSAFSLAPRASFWDSRQLVLFLMVPVVMRLARGSRAMRAVDVVLALGAAGALIGVIEFAMLGHNNANNRPMGMLSHYMTYAGVLMLVTCTAAARLLFYGERRVWPGVAVPALLAALAMSLTVNAYVGAAVAITTLLALRHVRLLLVVPVLVVIAVLLAPVPVRERVLSMSPQQDSNRDRLQMLEMGREIVRDHPVFGVGPNMIGRVYGQYLQPNPVHTYNPHLHNVPAQIAAERGVPALVMWLAFVVTALISLIRQLRRGPARSIAGAGVAALVAMLAAGLFEYNFGDSEFLMLFLGLITLPFAARLPDADSPSAVPIAATPAVAGQTR